MDLEFLQIIVNALGQARAKSLLQTAPPTANEKKCASIGSYRGAFWFVMD